MPDLKSELRDIEDMMQVYGVVVIDSRFTLHKTLERKGYQVFSDSNGWSGTEWYAALAKFDIENWHIELPNGDLWFGGEHKPTS